MNNFLSRTRFGHDPYVDWTILLVFVVIVTSVMVLLGYFSYGYVTSRIYGPIDSRGTVDGTILANAEKLKKTMGQARIDESIERFLNR